MDLITIDPKRQQAAAFIALADEHAEYITTSDLYTETFVRAFTYATHMVKGGSYTDGESQIIYTQLRKLEKKFA